MTTPPHGDDRSPGPPNPSGESQAGGTGSPDAPSAPAAVQPKDALARLLDRRGSQDGARAEALLRALLDASPLAMWVLDPRGHVVLWNHAAEQLTGWTADEVLGRLVPIIPADKADEFRRLFDQALAKEPVIGAEVRRQRKDGSALELSLSSAALVAPDGTAVAVLVMAADLTARKEAEAGARKLASERAAREAADAARQQLAHIVESISDGYAAYDREWRYTYMNRRYAEMLRKNDFDPAALIGRVVWDAHPEIIGTKFQTEALRAASEGQPVEFDEHYAKQDQTFNVRVFPTPEGFVSITRDVSERRRAERALRESEARFRSLVQASAQIVWKTDAEGRIVSPVPDWTAITGQTSAAAQGLGMLDTVHADDREQVGRLWLEAVANKRPFTATFRLQTAGGTYRWFAARGVPILAEDGSVREWVGTSTDIHERKSAEAAFRESERRYRRIFDTVEVSIWEQDFSQVKAAVDKLKKDGVTDIRRYLGDNPHFASHVASLMRVNDVNDATLTMFGARTKAELQQSLDRLFTAGTSAMINEEIIAIFEGQERFQSEAPCQTLDGRELQVALTIGFPDDDPELRSVLVSLIDITDRKRADAEREKLLGAERAARQRIEQLQRVTAALVDAVTVEDVADRVVETVRDTTTAKSATLSLLTSDGSEFEVIRMMGLPEADVAKWKRFPVADGYPSTEAVRTGEPIFLRSPEEIRERFPVLAAGSEQYGFAASAILPLAVAGVRVGTLGLNYAGPQPFDAGKRAYLAAVAQQCAQALERARLFEAERTARAESESARQDADTARASAERASRAKSDFLATMSHELRTPLNAIIGYQSLLADGVTGPVSDSQRRQLERIGTSAHHLLSLIDEVLTLSRVEAGKESVHADPVDVAVVLDEAASIIEPLAKQKNLEFVVTGPATPITIETDSGKLRQAILNLLSNAVKFTGRGRITLRASAAGDAVEFEVRDTGIGIAAQHLERVFEPFWQVEASTTRTAPGTGLGLAVTRRLVLLLGGTVTVQSAMGEGSTFTIRLPRTPAAQ
jgi:PAS domain S-box-containing protein